MSQIYVLALCKIAVLIFQAVLFECVCFFTLKNAVLIVGKD